MKIFKDLDPVRIRRAVEAFDAEGRTLLVPAGSRGTVVLVNGPPASPQSYDIDFYLEDEGSDVLAADVAADSVEAIPG